MTVGSLFAGIGGFDLGFERAGYEIAWQVERDEFANRVLAKHWPHVPRFLDVYDCGAGNLSTVDVICGGFPCQPFSSASRGRKHGTGDHRWLWPEMRRIIAELRPTWVVGENVAHLDGPALEQVVSDLEADAYEVQTLEVPACAFGHDHRRTRLWILGHTDSDRKSRLRVDAEVARLPRTRDDAGRVGAAHGVSGRLDGHRMRGLGNSIAPAIAEWIASHIKAAEMIGSGHRASQAKRAQATNRSAAQ